MRINEIAFGGQSFKAPGLPKKEAKPKKVKAATEEHDAAPAAKKTAKPNDKEAGKFAWSTGEKDAYTSGSASGVRAGSR